MLNFKLLNANFIFMSNIDKNSLLDYSCSRGIYAFRIWW